MQQQPQYTCPRCGAPIQVGQFACNNCGLALDPQNADCLATRARIEQAASEGGGIRW